MDYNQTLQWLQSLLGNQQGINTNEFGQSLSAQQQGLSDTLANQRALQAAGLTEQGREYDLGNELSKAGLAETGRQFDVSTALQKVIADWQNQLANKEFGLKQGAFDFGKQQYADTRNGMTAAQLNNEAFLKSLETPTDWTKSWVGNPNNQNIGYYAGNGATYNPYTYRMTSSVGIPVVQNTVANNAVPARNINY